MKREHEECNNPVSSKKISGVKTLSKMKEGFVFRRRTIRRRKCAWRINCWGWLMRRRGVKAGVGRGVAKTCHSHIYRHATDINTYMKGWTRIFSPYYEYILTCFIWHACVNKWYIYSAIWNSSVLIYMYIYININ